MWAERSHQIDTYIAQGGESVIQSTETLLFMGERQVLPVYKLPIEYVSFNVMNGRFAAEKRKIEQDLGFQIDNRNPEHEKYFMQLLLPKVSKTDKLKEDIIKYGQLKPGVITHDGFLIDANRRLATLKTLNNQYPSSKYQYILVHRLPANIPQKEIYKLEFQLQIKDDLKEKYNPINDLLKIKEGLEIMDPVELADTASWKVSDILYYTRRLELIDGFLEFLGDPGNYTKVLDFNEHFVEFQKELKMMKQAGLAALKIDEAIDAFYYALKINLDPNFHKTVTHSNHIRNIREAFFNDKIHGVLTRNMFTNPNASTEDIYNDISAAAELIRVQRANEKPIEHLRKAINFLSQISEDSNGIQSDEFKEGLDELETLVVGLREIIDGDKYGEN